MEQDQPYGFQQFAPGGLLAPYVQCFWTLQAPAQLCQGLERVPADGHVNVMFRLADPFKRFRADGQGKPQVHYRSTLLGGRSRGYFIEQLGDARYVAIRFRPGGLAPFLRLPMSELTDQSIDLELLWGPAVRQWEEQLFEATTPQQIVHILIHTLLSRFREPPYLPAMQAAVRRINTSLDNISICALAGQLGWSTRHFERLFAGYVGLPPKRYARIARFQGRRIP